MKNFPLEAVIWLIGLVLLALGNPSEADHFTICPLAFSGIEWCPGCGLGRSITQFFHGNIRESFVAHPLGIFAVIVLSFRIFTLSKAYYKTHGKSN